ncbi:hypothetical protein PFISCL1PPCAC_9311, partial [Pristionchus fissidentatus]
YFSMERARNLRREVFFRDPFNDFPDNDNRLLRQRLDGLPVYNNRLLRDRIDARPAINSLWQNDGVDEENCQQLLPSLALLIFIVSFFGLYLFFSLFIMSAIIIFTIVFFIIFLTVTCLSIIIIFLICWTIATFVFVPIVVTVIIPYLILEQSFHLITHVLSFFKRCITAILSSILLFLFSKAEAFIGCMLSSLLFFTILFLDVSSDLFHLIFDQVEEYFVSKKMNEISNENSSLRRKLEEREKKYRRLLMLL